MSSTKLRSGSDQAYVGQTAVNPGPDSDTLARLAEMLMDMKAGAKPPPPSVGGSDAGPETMDQVDDTFSPQDALPADTVPKQVKKTGSKKKKKAAPVKAGGGYGGGGRTGSR